MTISLLKGTAVLSILSVAELMRATTRISTHGAAVELFSRTALLYLAVGVLTSRAFAVLERRVQLRTG